MQASAFKLPQCMSIFYTGRIQQLIDVQESAAIGPSQAGIEMQR